MLKAIFYTTILMMAVLTGAAFAQKDSARQIEMREQFRNETGRYRMSVLYLMQVHDMKLIVNGSQAYRPPVREDDWAQLKKDLAELEGLCKTKYAGITNPRNSDSNLDAMPATWCEIAANHRDYETRGRQMAAADRFNPALRGLIAEVREAVANPESYIDEKIQLLMYEREKWRAAEAVKFQKRFEAMKVSMPSDFFKEVEAEADELIAVNARLAPNRSFLLPKHKDAAVEAFVRGRYATLRKGVQILKIGLDDAFWVIHRNGLGVPTSQTKVARLLVKIPNRPFCQEHSIAAERIYKGGGYGAMTVDGGVVGGEGLFMKCE